uniref:mucin-2-like n=1 Tax=Pristiophorus japonicus TaxID=55135 RepID=UPI00398E32C5
METLILCLFLVCSGAVCGGRLSDSAGRSCCEPKLPQPLNISEFNKLQNYVTLSGQGRCPEYLVFTTNANQRFCILSGKAQAMKEFVDARSIDPGEVCARTGGIEQTETGKGTPHPAPPTAGPTIPISSSSITAVPGLHGQERTFTLQPTPNPPTRAHWLQRVAVTTRNTAGETSGTSLHPRNIVTTTLTSPPNKHEAGEDRTMEGTYSPDPGEVCARTGGIEQTETGEGTPHPAPPTAGPTIPISSSSITAVPGLHGQERTFTLQPTLNPPTRAHWLQRVAVTTRNTAGETSRTSLHPRNIVTTTLTSPPNKHEAGEDRTMEGTYSPGSTTSGRGGARMGHRVGPGVGGLLHCKDCDEQHRYSAGEVTAGQWLALGLLASAIALLLTAAILFASIKFKCTQQMPDVMVRGVRYSRICGLRTDTV